MTHDIGKIIADLRVSCGWTQNELAQKLNVSDKAISKWEKGNGMPSIEFLPMLAELFNVSVDYILTGKQSHQEVSFISKEEYYAQKDDPYVPNEEIDCGKLSQYALQYDSEKVLAALVDSGKGRFFDQSCYRYDYQKMTQCNYTEAKSAFIESGLSGIVTDKFYDVVFKLMHINKERAAYGKHELFRTSIELRDMRPDERIVNYLIDNYEHLPKEQQEYYFGTSEGINANENGWIIGFPHLLHRAYITGKVKLVELILEHMEIANSYIREKSRELYDHYNYRSSGIPTIMGMPEEVFLIRLRYPESRPLRETAEAAYAKHNKKWGDRLNGLLQSALTEYEIKAIWVDNDKSKSEQEKLIEKAFHGDLIWIDDVLKIDDFEIIKKLINENPIHQVEIVYDLYRHKKWSKLLEYVGANDSNFKTTIEREDWNAVENLLLERYWNEEACIRQNKNLCCDPLYVYAWNNLDLPNKQYLRSRSGDFEIYHRSFHSLSECIDYVKRCKQKALIDYQQKIAQKKAQVQLQSEKEKTDYLTKDYFETELSKGNIDLVIVKLCVRLEAVLRCDYHLEGDFSEILTAFCGDSGETANVLNKLRRNRNNIVHSASDATILTADEIHACIDYICELTK